jgi:pimeloyl-ACP methyl ester carboxylesterase
MCTQLTNHQTMNHRGAKVAMTLALRFPTSYSGLVSVDNAPVDAALKSDFSTYVKAMREIEEKNQAAFAASGKGFRQSDADAILRKYEPDLSIRQFLLTNFVRNPSRSDKSGPQYQFRIPLQTLAKSLPGIADFPCRNPDETRYEGPTLIVRGTRSHYVADESLPLIGRYFPKFELLDIDSGHWVMSEKLEEFRRGVVDWMDRCVEKW